MKNTVNMDAMKAGAVLSGFNWYKVNVNRDGKESEFYATELEVTHEGATIKIHRQFATPEYMGGFTKITAAAENCIVFEAESMDYSSGNGRRIAIKYTVEGLRKDFADLEEGGGSIEQPETLIDRNRSGADGNGNMFVVLDFRKLGYITEVQKAQIKKYINVECRGQASKYQTPRTVYFKICADGNIYVGAWDYATEQPMTERPYYETWHILDDEDDIKDVEALRKLAQTVAAAM